MTHFILQQFKKVAKFIDFQADTDIKKYETPIQ